MFRRLTMAIFRLYMKYLVSSYTRFIVLYIVWAGGELGTRSRMCLEVGRCGYMGMLLFYIMSMLIWLSYYVLYIHYIYNT